MGMRASATLAYGYCWSNQQCLFGTNEEDDEPIYWEEALLRKRGLDKDQTEWEIWQKAKTQLQQDFGVDVDYHGYCDGESPLLYVVGTKTRTTIPQPTRIELPPVQPQWAAMLERWFQELGIPKPQPEPGWWLMADYG